MDKLSKIAKKYQTDKSPDHHNYTPSYFHYFKGLENSPLVLWESGIGGYHYPDRGGASLKMWEEFFPKGEIHGFDIYDKSLFCKGRVHTHIGSQTDGNFLNHILKISGAPDIIIDDGSHISDDCIKFFEITFPMLKKGGIFIVEDTETSYWKEHFYGSDNIDDLTVVTTTNYFKRLSDSLNRTKFNYTGPVFDIWSINFHRGFIAIIKNQ